MLADIPILHREHGVVVVDKPAGVVSTERVSGDVDCVVHAVSEQLGRPLWAVHQLDKDTSGVFVLVEKKSLVPKMQEQLRQKKHTHKHYLMVVHGEVPFKKKTVDAPLLDDKVLRMQVVHEDGKKAVTQLLRRGVCMAPKGFAKDADGQRQKLSLVEARLLTGRTHQIRAHMHFLGHPLVGEQRYTERQFKTETCAQSSPSYGALFARQMLHAWHLHLEQPPVGDAPLDVTAPFPPPFHAALTAWFAPSLVGQLRPTRWRRS